MRGEPDPSSRPDFCRQTKSGHTSGQFAVTAINADAWSEIATALGISRQAAWERLRKLEAVSPISLPL
jgi:Winged helix-turn-helix DNA-binding